MEKQTETISFRVSADFREALQRVSAEERRPLSQWIRFCLEDAVEEREHEEDE